jgi:hypothetical protein
METQAFEQGFQDYEAGEPSACNPFDHDTQEQEWRDWTAGFEHASEQYRDGSDFE